MGNGRTLKASVGIGVLLCLVIAGALADDAPVGRWGSFNFVVEIDGVPVGTFADMSGLSVEQEVIEFRDGSDPDTTRKLPGPTKFSNLVLKRGLIAGAGDFFHEWLLANRAGGGAPVLKSGVIVALERSSGEVKRWNFTHAWPAKYEVSVMAVKGNDVMIESITLAVEKWENLP